MTPLFLLVLLLGICFFSFIMLYIKKPKLLLLIPVILILLVVFSLFAFKSNVYRTVNTPVQTLTSPPVYQNIRPPIWSEGIEERFEADVYPSKISAIRGLGNRINKQIPFIIEEIGTPEEILIFQNAQDLELVEELRDVIAKPNQNIRCRIGFENVTQVENKIGIYFFINTNYAPRLVRMQKVLLNDTLTSGTIRANILANQRQQASVAVNFSEKPWVEEFSTFTNSQPDKQYIIAKSNETCLTPEEADRQAMQNVHEQLVPMLIRFQNSFKLENKDIFESGMVVDKFLQSFDGLAGKIWREALLLDVSPAQLQRLADNIAGLSRTRIKNWAETIFSIIGMLLLITVVYIFLNAATKGYYLWSLRIVGVILALILLFIILSFS